jgi:hypothetical protein
VKLEFFEDGLDRPVLLLHGGEAGEMARLREALRPLSEHVNRRLALHELPFVRPCGGCSLIAISGPSDVGVQPGREPGSFIWTLEPSSWAQTCELLEPFDEVEPGTRFQYLNPSRGPMVIYSTERGW